MPKSSQAGIGAAETTFGYETTASIKKWMESSKGSVQEEEEVDTRFEMTYDGAVEGRGKQETDVLEVWFAGCHCDVGGGSVSNDTPHNLARIPLRWMIRQCFAANTGIRFHTQLLRNVGLDPATLYPVVRDRPAEVYATKERVDALRVVSAVQPPAPASPIALSPSSALPLIPPPMHERTESAKTLVHGQEVAAATTSPIPGALTEEEEDLLDALCPVYDQLTLAPGWWVLEVVPLVQRYQLLNNEWTDELTVNWGRARDVPRLVRDQPGEGQLLVHRSVKVQMEAKGLVEVVGKGKTEGGSYVPRPKLPPVEEIEWAS